MAAGLQRGFRSRDVVGRRIVSVDLRPRWDSGGRYQTQPIIYLDDGTYIAFSVTEYYDGSDYGVKPLVVTPDRRRQKRTA